VMARCRPTAIAVLRGAIHSCFTRSPVASGLSGRVLYIVDTTTNVGLLSRFQGELHVLT
jgi:hypothetical protein